MKNPRIQAFYYQWIGTQNNHAGMAYFARCLKRDLNLPLQLLHNSPKDLKIVNLAKHYSRLTLPWTDCVFLMEYLTPIGIANQENVALRLRQWGYKKPIIGLVHLPESLLLKYWKMEYIRSALDNVDYIMVYGSTLTKFFERIGYGHKVIQTFHYVDADYYYPIKEKNNKFFTVHFCGSLMRNIDILKEVVQQCPEISFKICAGIGDLKSKFEGLSNVSLYSFLPENELLLKMQESNASISVMEDTIGSNAIMSGLACGLPQIVSDVGSIRDYCSEENSFFCREVNDYVKAIRLLSQNKDLCLKMGNNARQRAEELCLPKSIEWFREFFIRINQSAFNAK